MSSGNNLVQAQPIAVWPELLKGKIAVVTGASRGIGAATARLFAAAGASVVLAARDGQALAALAGAIQSDGGMALALPTDVDDPAAIERLVQRTLETFGRLDLAVNNAGVNEAQTLLAELPLDEFDRVVRVNLRGVFVCMKHEIRAMLRSGGGAIVNVASAAGVQAGPRLAAYTASKHGVVGLTRTAAIDYGAQHIRANVVALGPIDAGMLAQAPETARRQAALAMPMQRIGTAAEVAAAIAWLCSDQAGYITGAILPIDGGHTAR
mgnify:CR=1 FL=1